LGCLLHTNTCNIYYTTLHLLCQTVRQTSLVAALEIILKNFWGG